MNSNWTRWVRASIVKHFSTLLTTVPMYVEGRERPLVEAPELFELRIDGPNIRDFSGLYRLEIEINILIKCMRNPSDAYKIERLIGLVQSSFTNAIVVKNYGEETPAEQIGCLLLRSDGREGIITSDFGLIDASQGTRQATVEAHYLMELRK